MTSFKANPYSIVWESCNMIFRLLFLLTPVACSPMQFVIAEKHTLEKVINDFMVLKMILLYTFTAKIHSNMALTWTY